MTPYVFMMVFWLVIYYYLLYQTKGISENRIETRKKFFVFFAGLALLVIMGLRHEYVGVDTSTYLQLFHMSDLYEWKELFTISKGTSFMDLLDEERGFWLVCKVLRTLHVSDQMFLFLYAMAVTCMVSSCIKKYSKNPFWGFYLMATLGFFTMGMSGIRQTLAACILLYGIDCMIQRKPIKYILLVLLATSFHQSAIFCIIFYFFRNVRINKANGLILAILSVTSILLRSFFTSILNYFIPQKFENLYGLNNTRYIVNPMVIAVAVLIPLFCLFFWEKSKTKTEFQKQVCSICFLGSFCNVVITALSISSLMIGRMSYYFVFYNVILLGNIISDIEDRNTRYIASVFAVLLPGYMFFKSQSLGIAPYYFFWQTYGM